MIILSKLNKITLIYMFLCILISIFFSKMPVVAYDMKFNDVFFNFSLGLMGGAILNVYYLIPLCFHKKIYILFVFIDMIATVLFIKIIRWNLKQVDFKTYMYFAIAFSILFWFLIGTQTAILS